MERIGLFGGSFNPVTCGHLLIAQAALEELALDRLFFIPAAQSPFKLDLELAPATDRLRLLRLALAGGGRYEIDTQEIERGGISFTVDTLRVYRRRYPAARLYCLVGADHAQKLPEWREPEALAALAEFAVSPRPGETVAALPSPFHGQVLRGIPMGVSSSLVRERIAAGVSIEGLVPPTVAEALKNSNLYR